MSELKLEVGKTYINKIKDKVCIWGKHPNGRFYGFNGYNDYQYYPNGRIATDDGCDLVSEYTEPEKLSGWINVYNDGYHGCVRKTKEEAKISAVSNCVRKRIACIDLSQFNEGEGL